uniref:Uncharacterized protein n=1 Tax=Oryza punctata TaxID=4537 RepID=A0A0E0MLT9_ORYPU
MAPQNKEESPAVNIDLKLGPGVEAVTESDEARAHAANVATDKVMSVSANLAQLLPTGSVLAYQSLSASFTNQGDCFRANRWLSLCLVVFLSASCIFFAFTDSVLYKGKAQPLQPEQEEQKLFQDLKPELDKRGLGYIDVVHAIFSAVVFLSVAFSDVGLQKCFFPNAGKNDKELLKNLPLGMAVLSSFVFMIFPTKRRGIGSHCSSSENIDESSSKSGKNIDGSSSNSGEKEKANKPTTENK